jgi:hypothetical protein
MHLDDPPVVFPFFQHARPPYIFPTGRLALPLIDVVQNAVIPSHIARLRQGDLQVIETDMVFIYEVS